MKPIKLNCPIITVDDKKYATFIITAAAKASIFLSLLKYSYTKIATIISKTKLK